MSMFILVFVEWLCGTYWNTAYGNRPWSASSR